MCKIYKRIKRKLYIISNPIKYHISIRKHKLIAHALGGIEEYEYTNSLEALKNSYDNGFRLFEVDIRLTKDNILVLNHGGWQNRLGYDKDHEMIDYETFMNCKIHNKYTTMSFKDLVSFMQKHKDIYVMIDIGKKTFKGTQKIYKKIINDSQKDYRILQRLIVGGHNSEMINAIKELRKFSLFNLYCPASTQREPMLNTSDAVINYCKKNKINSISVPLKDYDETLINLAKKNKIITYLFTINEQTTLNKYTKKVNVIGTDFLKEKTSFN